MLTAKQQPTHVFAKATKNVLEACLVVYSVQIISLNLYYSLGKLLFLKTCHGNDPQGMHVRPCKHL